MEGLFARAFRSGVQPVELGKRLVREVEDGRTVGVNRVVRAQRYVYQLSPGDRERFADYEVALGQELAALAVDTAGERDWAMLGPARIEFETADDLEVGRFRLRAGSRPTSRSGTTPPPAAGAAAAQPVGPHTAMLPGQRPRPKVQAPASLVLVQGGQPIRTWPLATPRSRSAGPSSPTSPWPTRAVPQPRPGGPRGRRLHRRGPPLDQRHRGQRPADPAPPPGQRRHAEAGQLDPPVPAGGLMPPIFLLLVKIAFLVILYLFVARAVRAVTLDVFGPRAERRRARPARAPPARCHGPAARGGRPGACPASWW